ncbi:MAG: LysR family transcriptional regulator [Candidatus Eisenbacteria bacterium]|uniref:LysR family transcriptional regulator n=1 Tax=Eiseniibacteriota bacterium TaxID=2212470 RepID=A0A948RZE9_UNCEI|nr:LysR family transcriptional regulator [Candidatus Eisenbacteria bacterium]MBU1951079.1 LysR family transcriptional regulator [Candidatus Eisenbacteria bacterium]MBU2693216.1 LysR family transcriptional regulator [Candidatus Eisenbacteria bacterium]
MRIRTSIWIEDEDGQVVYGLGRQRILVAIRETGSIKAAAAELNMSYRGLWARLRHSERRLGFSLVDSKPGRGKSGGTTLTPEANELLDRYQRVLNEVYSASEAVFTKSLSGLFRKHESDKPGSQRHDASAS